VFHFISLALCTLKDAKLVFNLIALFWDTKVAKPPFYSIGPNIQVNDAKLVYEPECTSLGY
jgi:hypothetical protein